MIRAALFASLVAACGALPAWAEEPRGCDKFSWPLQKEQTALKAPNLPVVANASAGTASPVAMTLQLLKFGNAGLMIKPERGPKQPESYAGYVTFAAPSEGLQYQVTISEAAWIDVVQADQYVKSSAFSGALDCPGVRKSVRFDLQAIPFTVQFSDVSNSTLNVVVAPVPNTPTP